MNIYLSSARFKVSHCFLVSALLLPVCLFHATETRAQNPIADTVFLDGKIITVDQRDSIVEALAIRRGRILDVGSNAAIKKYIGQETNVIRLDGKTVIPGIVAAHCHAVGVAQGTLTQTHAELLSIAEVQAWIRHRATEIPNGNWIKVPRSDITRLKERRHPTTAELDAACTTHPVIFTAARKNALNSLGLRLVGVDDKSGTIPGGEVIRDDDGRVRLIAGANAQLRKLMPRAEHPREKVLAALRKVHQHYNAVGITSIFERAGGISNMLFYRELRENEQLSVRMTQTFRSGFRSAEQVEQYVKKLGMKTGDGDDWVRVGPLKIVVDGGIHWGNTYLREPYGKRRIKFYVHKDPNYRGDVHYSADQMTEVFRAGHRLGWQWCCHVTGDAGVDRVLEALAAVHKEHPEIAERRFSLTHAYFPAVDSIRKAAKLGVCVDTQSSLYFKDSAAIAEMYGKSWAERFIGLGDWLSGGVPTAIAGDHMVGLDPDRAMNAYNPFLMLYVAVTRKNRDGIVYGAHQKVSRLKALRCVTINAAHLEFTERQKGSLEKGKLADLAVLDRDYLECPDEQIRQIKVSMTMLDGNIVFRRESKDQNER